MNYAIKPQGVFGLLKDCFTAYPKVLRHIWYLVVISGLLNMASSALLKINLYVGGSITVLVLLAVMFMYAVALHLSHTALSGAKPHLEESMANARRRYLRFLGGYLLLILLFLMIMATAYGFAAISDFDIFQKIAPVFYALAVIFCIGSFFLLYFVLPIIVIDHQSAFKSLDMSVKWVWQYKWPIYAVLILIYAFLITAVFAGIKFIPTKDLVASGIFNFVLQFLIYPFMISTVLVLMNDMKVRQRLQK